MKNVIFLFISLTLLVEGGFSQTFDPGYTKKFGYGVILASLNGYPEFNKFDETQFNVKDNIFMFPAGEETTIDLRVILPQGTTVEGLMSKLRSGKPQNIKNKIAEKMVWSVWCSHSGGKSQVTAERPWPQKKTDIPLWAAPCVEVFQDYDVPTLGTRNTTGLKWAPDGGNLKFQMGSTLQSALPGNKFYITWRVAYQYSVPGGQPEQKWNSDLNKWETKISAGGVGYIYSDPVAVCVVEIEAYDDPAGRFADNGNGTVTDTKANLIWMKTPPGEIMYWDDAQSYAEKLVLAGFSDWRLPKLAELKEMMKISKMKDSGYECKWLNENGFSNIQAKSYWCGDACDRGKNLVDFESKTTDCKETNYEFCCWVVREKK